VQATGATSGNHYEQLVRRQRAELQDAYLKGVRRLRWDAGRLAAERERRLRELLVYAADRSPFWRERLAGRDLANFTESDLPSLPVLTRAEMMAEFDQVVTVPGLTLARIQQHLDKSNGEDRLGRLHHLRDAGLALDRPTRRRPGRGAGAGLRYQHSA
jgi:phenylacetate-CoA ligase